MSEISLALSPECRREDLFAFAARAGWTLQEERPRTFSVLGGAAWTTADGLPASYIEVHPLGVRLLNLADQPALLAGVRAALPALDREELLALAHDGRMEQRAFALRALAFLEQSAPSAPLLAALRRAADDPSRFFRRAVINLCWIGAITDALDDLYGRRTDDDAELGADWAALRDRRAPEEI
ncbi:MAG TPA: hypothetical protein VFS21_04595 [Roseiflexaceae bacterium]|nr:hypothetical protein [Roseiflexaceae bacterium]